MTTTPQAASVPELPPLPEHPDPCSAGMPYAWLLELITEDHKGAMRALLANRAYCWDLYMAEASYRLSTQKALEEARAALDAQMAGQSVPGFLIFSARNAIAKHAGVEVTADTNAVIAATLRYLRARAPDAEAAAPAHHLRRISLDACAAPSTRTRSKQ